MCDSDRLVKNKNQKYDFISNNVSAVLFFHNWKKKGSKEFAEVEDKVIAESEQTSDNSDSNGWQRLKKIYVNKGLWRSTYINKGLWRSMVSKFWNLLSF